MKKINKEFLIHNKKAIISISFGTILFLLAFFIFIGKELDSEYLVGEVGASNSVEVGDIVSDEDGLTEIEDSYNEEMLVVDVGGAVKKPGVQELEQGSRVYEAVEKAGGLLEDADTDNINMAICLEDGTKLYVPFKVVGEGTESNRAEMTGDDPNRAAGGSPQYQAKANIIYNVAGTQILEGSGVVGKVNINTATSELLQTLKGVGPSTADKIINYRNTNGKFKNIEQITEVNGIGEKTLEKFREQLTI